MPYAPVDSADRLSARPDGAAPIYPVISMSAPTAHVGSRAELIGEQASKAIERNYNPSLHVPSDAAPTFLLHAEDDLSVPVANRLMLREALIAAEVPVETHLFRDGGHGFGLRLSKGHSVEGSEEVLGLGLPSASSLPPEQRHQSCIVPSSRRFTGRYARRYG
jgi:acetyl esterase/lipase